MRYHHVEDSNETKGFALLHWLRLDVTVGAPCKPSLDFDVGEPCCEHGHAESWKDGGHYCHACLAEQREVRESGLCEHGCYPPCNPSNTGKCGYECD